MRIEGNTLIFKSTPSHFYKEQCGDKNNTVRTLGIIENMRLVKLISREKKLNIKINNTQTTEGFIRKITDISSFKNHLIFTWDKCSGEDFS